MKTALSGSVREDRQVKTDDACPGDCPIISEPFYTCSCKEPRVATSGRAYLEAEGWGLGGQTVETKGGLSEQTKQRLAGYRHAKHREDWRHGFSFCFIPINLSNWHLTGKWIAFMSYQWLAYVHDSLGYWCDELSETQSEKHIQDFTVEDDVIITSDKDVVFSVHLVCLLSVCQQDFRKNCWPDSHETYCKGVPLNIGVYQNQILIIFGFCQYCDIRQLALAVKKALHEIQ